LEVPEIRKKILKAVSALVQVHENPGKFHVRHLNTYMIILSTDFAAHCYVKNTPMLKTN